MDEEKAKEYLSQTKGIEFRIQSILNEIKYYKELATSTAVIISGMPRNPNKGTSKVENSVVKIVDCGEELQDELTRLLDKKEEIKQTIKTVNDPKLQTILELKYISNLKWKQISMETGYGVDNLYKLHKKALSKIKIP